MTMSCENAHVYVCIRGQSMLKAKDLRKETPSAEKRPGTRTAQRVSEVSETTLTFAIFFRAISTLFCVDSMSFPRSSSIMFCSSSSECICFDITWRKQTRDETKLNETRGWNHSKCKFSKRQLSEADDELVCRFTSAIGASETKSGIRDNPWWPAAP